MKKIVKAFVPLLAMGLLTSCFGSNDKKESGSEENQKIDYKLFIKASSTSYIIEQDNDLGLAVDETNSVLPEGKTVTFAVKDNSIGAKIENGKFKATSAGTAEVYATVDNLQSSNLITVKVETVSENVKDKVKRVIEKENLELGVCYDIGISKENAKSFSISKGSDYFKINDDGKLEVIGFGRGEFELKCLNEVLYAKDFSAGGSILCRIIRDDLFAKGLIPSNTANVPNSLLGSIEEINLSGKLINDQNAKEGVRYLKGLKRIDLSSNDIDDFSFVDGLANLEEIDLSHNLIKDIDFLYESRKSIVSLDLSDNLITSLSSLKFFSEIKYLNLSENNISNIDFLSELTTLESLLLNNNKIGSFTDKLANLLNLKELGLGYCGLDFSSIQSFHYLNNITYLDISETSTKLDSIKSFSNIEELIMKDCSLFEDDLSKLNQFKSLKHLDISNNFLSQEDVLNVVDPAALTGIEYLGIGGNEFDVIPDFVKELPNLKTLDLTNSYNLDNLSSLKGLTIDTLILDSCNSIGSTLEHNTDCKDAYLEVIDSLSSLKNLSIVSGLNYMSRDLFDELTSRVKDDKFHLKFLDGDYVTKDTVNSYINNVCFSIEDFLRICDSTKDGDLTVYTVKSNYRHITLSLVNDESAEVTNHYLITIPKTLRKLDIFGNVYKTYDMSFKVANRKESSMMFNFHDFANSTGDNFVIDAYDGSRTYVVGYGNTKLSNTSKVAVLNLYDCYVRTNDKKNSSLTIQANGVGKNGGSGHRTGYTGPNGIYCHSFRGEGKVTIKGGKGGKGDNHDFSITATQGYAGGDGGAAVSISSTGTHTETKDVVFIGGEGGAGGNGNGIGGWSGDKGATGSSFTTH